MGRKRKAGDRKLAVLYVRASKSEQVLTPQAQRDAAARWCDHEGVDLLEVHEDLGICRATPIDRRPGLLDALAALGEHGAGTLLVAKRDRIGRDALISAMIEKLAGEHGAMVQAADGAGNGDGPEAQLMRRILDAFSEFERAQIRARTRAALRVKKSRGERVSGRIPFGWKLQVDGVHLVADDDEQEIIRTARDLRAEGMTLRAVGDALAARGMLPRSRCKWSPKLVSKVVAGRASA